MDSFTEEFVDAQDVTVEVVLEEELGLKSEASWASAPFRRTGIIAVNTRR
jgi:hypothetical protein